MLLEKPVFIPESSIKKMITPQSTPKSKRITSIDIVKGIAIIMVVYGHVMQGMAHRNLMYMPFHIFSDTFIYSFHMPAFFFASGLFARLNANTSSTVLIQKKGEQLLWPYLLWALISLVTSPFVSQYTSVGSHSQVFKDVISGIVLGTQSWFLWTLFFVYVIGILTRKVDRRLLLLISLALYYMMHFYGSILPGSANRIFTMLPYFVLSSRWSDEITRILVLLETNTGKMQKANRFITGLLLALFLFLSVAITINFNIPALVLLTIKLLQGLTGTFLLILIAASISPSRIGAVLTTVGIASLAIFLLHPYFQGLSRLMVSRIAGEHNAMAIVLSVMIQTVAGVWGATIIYSLTMRYGGRWLFHFPQRNKTAVPALSKAS